MKKTWKPTVAGVLCISESCLKFVGVFALIIAIVAVRSEHRVYVDEVNPVGILVAIAVPLAALAVLAMVGGILALQRKSWGLALAGSIAAVLPFSLVGMAALILTALSRDEFE
jgi:hypothetical protein